jgi:NAD(P)-dependent dehydrogenase (short-subunit alcohol dehydrogenase family)
MTYFVVDGNALHLTDGEESSPAIDSQIKYGGILAMSKRLEGKVAVITGGNSGIGLATAKEFANHGAIVALLIRTQEKIDAAIKEIGDNAKGYLGDVTDSKALKSLYENVATDFGGVDIVFSSAGKYEDTRLADTDEDLFMQLVDVNYKGTFFTVKYAVPHLRKGASVILVSSCLDEMGMEGGSVYNSTKAAVRSLGRSFTPELARIDARINVLSPGPIETPIHTSRGLSKEESDGVWKMFAERLPAGRVGQVEEMAKTALFLASDDSSFMYGSEIQADGGMNQVRW